MQKLSCNNLFVLFFTFLLSSPISAVQVINAPTPDKTDKRQPLNIPYSKGKITLDGELDEDLWSNALVIDLNIVNNPWDNLPSPVKTTAKLIENGEFLYVSFVALDPDGHRIRVNIPDQETKDT